MPMAEILPEPKLKPPPRPTVNILRNEPQEKSDPLAEQQREHRKSLLREYRRMVEGYAADESADVSRLAAVESILGINPEAFQRAVEVHRDIERGIEALGTEAAWRARSAKIAERVESLATDIRKAEEQLRAMRSEKAELEAERRNRIALTQEVNGHRARGWLLVGDEDEALDRLAAINRGRNRSTAPAVTYPR